MGLLRVQGDLSLLADSVLKSFAAGGLFAGVS